MQKKSRREFLLSSGTIFRFDEYYSPSLSSTPKRVMCCLHGLYQTSATFQPLIEDLLLKTPDLIVVAINLTNFGVSVNATPELTSELLYQDLHSFYTMYRERVHGIQEWINVAYSISTLVTLLWYAHYPEDAKSISSTVLCAPLWFMSDEPVSFPNPHYFFGVYFKKNIFKNIVHSLFKNEGDYQHILSPFNQSHDFVSRCLDLKKFQVRFIVKHDKNLFLDLNTPIHLVYGDNDLLCPSSTAPRFKTHIPKSIQHVHILNGVGHFHLKHFGILNDSILIPLLSNKF